MSRAARVTAVPLVLAMMVGCDLEPDVGGPIAERCSNVDTDPATAVSFARDIQPIFAREQVGCTPCHDPVRENSIGVNLGGLDLSSYQALLRGGARSGASIVQPGKPCQSVLYQKVSAGPPFGSRMPLNGPPYLTEVELGRIHDWLAEGARDN